MKSKIFKKTIASISALAMVGTVGIVPITASAKSESISYDFEDANKVFTDDSRVGSAIEQDDTLASNVVAFTCANNAQNGYSFSHYDFSDLVKGAVSLTVEFDYYNTNGGRAILSLGDAATRGTTGGSSKTTYNVAGAAFNVGSNKSNAVVNNASLDLGTYTNKWMHVTLTADEVANTYSYEITNKANDSIITSAENVSYLSSDAAAINQIDLFGYINNSKCAMIDNLSINAEITESTLYDIIFMVDGTKSTETVAEGDTLSQIPSTEKTGYLFMGWTTDGDAVYTEGKTYISSEELSELPITETATYTAAYMKDPEYIEPIVSAEITGESIMTAGADTSTAFANTYKVVLTGELGTVITEENIDPRITDFNVTWDIDGFKTKNDLEGQYCDSYGEFATNNTPTTEVDFNLKDIPMNFYGNMSATVTYNGDEFVAKKAVAVLGNKAVESTQILPEAGYPSDFDTYADGLVGYETLAETYGGNDVIVGGWDMAGSDSGKNAIITEEDGNKFIRINAVTSSKSHVFTNSITSPATQAVFVQDLRFNSAGGAITLTSGYPFWSSSKYTNPVTVSFTGSALTLNGTEITNNDLPVAVNTGAWYKVVLSVDSTTKSCYVKVYNADGSLLGETPSVAWTEDSIPTYYSVGLGNSSTGSIDFDNYKAYYPTADASTYSLVSTQDTLSIPNGDTAELAASLKSTEDYDITGAATWTVLEDDMKEGVIITPDATDSHKAIVTLAEGAVAGDATVEVNIGGITKTIILSITSSAESIKFTKSKTSVSIPLDTAVTETAEFAASVVNGTGEDLGRDVTLSLYDKTNTNAYTLPTGITFDPATGILAVTSDAVACTFTVRATGHNSDGGALSRAVKVTVHGLSFDFGTGNDDDIAEGYTSVTPETSYTATRGYGITGVATAGGTASTEDANSDYLEGAITFDANVQPGKLYTVDITYEGALTTGYVNSDLAGYTLGEATEKTTASYTVPVIGDVLDLTVVAKETAQPRIYSVTVTKQADRAARNKPVIHHVGDSTSANNGSWAYCLARDYQTTAPELAQYATFYNNGAGGRNLSSYYTQGKLASVLNDIYPGDVFMFGNNGTNGMGSYFKDDVNYYLNAAEALGAKIILNSYTGHGAVGDYAAGYDSATATFNMWRRDSYDVVLREVAVERDGTDENYLGFVEIGKNADTIFDAYAADYATNNYASADEAGKAIVACYGDHNHYSENALACNLMLYGYDTTETKGIVEQITDIMAANVPAVVTYDVTMAAVENGTISADKTTAAAGEIVTVTATPAEGYKLDTITVNGVAIDGNTFVMPSNAVTVSATFSVVETKIVNYNPGDGTTPKSITATINNTDTDALSISVKVAVYNADGSLKTVKVTNDTVDAGSKKVINAAYPEFTENDDVRVFVWNTNTQKTFTERTMLFVK